MTFNKMFSDIKTSIYDPAIIYSTRKLTSKHSHSDGIHQQLELVGTVYDNRDILALDLALRFFHEKYGLALLGRYSL